MAASPHDAISDTHWLRADVDAFLMREAVALGAEYADEVQLESLEWNAGGAAGASAATGAARRSASTARGVVDATGPRGFLSRALGIELAARFAGYPGTQALFSHFTGVARCDEMPDYAGAGARGEAPPYPVDDAALHHVFDGGWMWVLRFGNGVTSAGVAVERRAGRGPAAGRRRGGLAPAARSLSHRAAISSPAPRPSRQFDWMPRLSYRAPRRPGRAGRCCRRRRRSSIRCSRPGSR